MFLNIKHKSYKNDSFIPKFQLIKNEAKFQFAIT